MLYELRNRWERWRADRKRKKAYPAARQVCARLQGFFADCLPPGLSLNQERVTWAAADALAEEKLQQEVLEQFQRLVPESPRYYIDGWEEYVTPLRKACEEFAGRGTYLDTSALDCLIAKLTLDGLRGEQLRSTVISTVQKDLPLGRFYKRRITASSKGALGYDRLNIRPTRGPRSPAAGIQAPPNGSRPT